MSKQFVFLIYFNNFDKNVAPSTRQRLFAKTLSMSQIPQLSVERLKFHLSRKPFSHHVLKIGRSFGYFSPNRIDGWLPLIDPCVSTSICPIILRRGFVRNSVAKLLPQHRKPFLLLIFVDTRVIRTGCIQWEHLGK